MKRKCINKKMNGRKEIFALVDNGDNSFTVLKLCENHNSQVRGGISKTWRFIGENRMNKVEAEKIFERRIKS